MKFHVLADGADPERPKTRADCEGGIRPCPWVSCRWNLYLDVGDDGRMKLNFYHLEPDQMGESCALDVADEGASTLEVVGGYLGVTRERVRQIEVEALATMQRRVEFIGIDAPDSRPVGAWDELVTVQGSGGGEADREPSNSNYSNARGYGFDGDAEFLERVFRIYEREIRYGIPKTEGDKDERDVRLEKKECGLSDSEDVSPSPAYREVSLGSSVEFDSGRILVDEVS